MKKTIYFILFTVFVAFAAFLAYWFYYPFAEGVKAGQLNNMMKKGYVFKTYEGRLIQTGLRSQQGKFGSYEFEFSVTDDELATKLMSLSGKNLELEYVEYKGKLPWRGYTNYVVKKIVSISEGELDTPIPFDLPADISNIE